MRVLTILTVASTLAATASAQTVSQLVDRVPATANAIVLLDLDALYDSPMAQRFGWSGAHEAASYKVPLMVPPSATLAMMAANIELSTMDSTWEVAAAVLDAPVSVDEIARSERGYVDEIAGTSVVWLSSGAYAIALDERLLGVAYPDNRQWASRWIDSSAESSANELSAPLDTSASLLRDGTAVVVAVDLRDVASVWEARDYLGVNQFGQTQDTDMMALANALASVQSLTMTISVDNEATGKIEVTFDEDISGFGEMAKPMLLGVARHIGIGMPDLEDWTASVRGRVVALEGTLGVDGMRRVLSVMEAPMPRTATPQVAEAAPSAPSAPAERETEPATMSVEEASQAYFAELSEMVNRLGINANRNMNEASTWFDRTATRIQRLDITNVDPALIDLGTEVSNHLRDAGRTLEMARQRGLAAASRVTYDAPSNTSRNNTSRQRAESRRRMSMRDQQREAAIMQELSKGMEGANQSLTEIDSAMRDVRRQMNEKYDIPF